MEILGKILGNNARVRIMRLFLLNRGKSFRNKDIVKRSQVSPDVVRQELRLLASVGFIKKRSSTSPDWSFNSLFKYAGEFEDLLVKSDSLNKQRLLDNFKKAGQIKLIIVSGVFIKNDDSRVDLLIVGDKMKRSKIGKEIRKLEAEAGVELVYAIFDTQEFIYRLSMYDKLVRDILDFPHEVLLKVRELNLEKVARH